MRFVTQEERQQLLDAEAARQRAISDNWHTNMTDVQVARFLRERQYDVTIPPDRPAEDVAQARDLEELSALTQRAPAFGAARSLIEFVRVEVVPIGANLEQTGPPMTLVAEAFNWYSRRPTDGVAATVTAGILAVHVERWSSWQTWLRRFDREIRTPLNPHRPEEQRFKVHFEPAPIGTPCRLEWWPPRAPERPHDPIPFRGEAEGRAIWNRMTAPFRSADRGGYLAWSCPPDLRFTSRSLAPGLRVLATGGLLPYYVVLDGRLTLTRVSGGFTDPDPLRCAPAWVLDEVRANVITKAVKTMRRRTPKKKPKARDSILDTVSAPTVRPRESWRPYPD